MMPIFVCKLFWMPSRPELNHTVALKPNHNLSVHYFWQETEAYEGLMHSHTYAVPLLLCLFQWLYGKQIKLLWTWGCIQMYFYILYFFFFNGTCHQMRELANLGVNRELKGCSQCFNTPWLKRETVCNLINKPENILIYTKSLQTC